MKKMTGFAGTRTRDLSHIVLSYPKRDCCTVSKLYFETLNTQDTHIIPLDHETILVF